MEEIWKDIDGYEGLYKVSNAGRVMSVHFGPKNVPVIGESKIMKISRSSSGYYHLQLYKDGKSSTKLIHKLVASAFIPNPKGKKEVNHIDGDKSNNNVTNLEWCTRGENQSHAIRTGLTLPPNLGKKGKLNHSSKPVLQYSLDGDFLKMWDSRADASRGTGLSACFISSCACGHAKSGGGFLWIPYEGGNIKEKIEPLKY